MWAQYRELTCSAKADMRINGFALSAAFSEGAPRPTQGWIHGKAYSVGIYLATGHSIGTWSATQIRQAGALLRQEGKKMRPSILRRKSARIVGTMRQMKIGYHPPAFTDDCRSDVDRWLKLIAASISRRDSTSHTEAIQGAEEPHIIKGCPRDKWEEVQAIQHEPFIYIKSNGSRWMGDEEGDISELLEVLAKHELDSRMFNHDFITVDPCEGVRDPHVYGKWIDGPRLYECDGVYSFFGNFVDVSHVFNIDTNHKPTIDALLAAIEANKIITVAS